MKKSFTIIFLITLALFTFHNVEAQKQDCIICPEMLGLATSTEHGVGVSTLTPSTTKIIASSEEQKNTKSNKARNARKNKRNKYSKNIKAKEDRGLCLSILSITKV